MTTFADKLYEMGGAPVGQTMIPPGGTWYYVDAANGSSSFDGLTPKTAKATIQQAYALTTSGKNDVVCLLASASGTQELTAITWSNNLTHLVGLGSPVHAAQRCRIVCAAADTGSNDMSPFFTVSGYGCTFSNVYIWQGQADASTLINVSVTGDRNYFYNVHFAGGGHATQAVDGCMSLQLDGCDENLFRHCTIGVDTVDAATGVACLSVPATGSAARNVFEECLFTLHAGNSGAMFVELLGNMGIDRYLLFRRCLFINLATSMTSAFVLAAGFDATSKRVLLDNCSMIGAGEWDSGNNAILFLNTGTFTGGTNSGFFLVSAT
jgi:hypothetical protein